MDQQATEKEMIGAWAQKNKLENALLVGMHGAPELKKDEKAHYLGEFKERIIKLLTQKQVAELIIYPEIVKALKDKNAAKMIINGTIDAQFYEKYTKLASPMKIPYTVLHDPELKGEVGLIIVSEQAVNNANMEVDSRYTRLKRLGLSKKLIGAVGKKICAKCYKNVLQAAPQEAENYRSLSFIDRLLGERCPAHKN